MKGAIIILVGIIVMIIVGLALQLIEQFWKERKYKKEQKNEG